MKNQKTNWWLDAILFISFIVTFLMDLTGVALHQWIGIGIGVIILIHLSSHWNWVETMIDRFFRKTSWSARINLIIDTTLVGGFLMIILTGLVISTWLSLTFINYDVWKTGHILTSVTTLFTVLLKIVLHRKWIICVADKYIFNRSPGQANPLTSQFQPARAQVSRREFLKISGVVGAASLVGISQLVKLVQATINSETQGLVAQVSQSTAIEPAAKKIGLTSLSSAKSSSIVSQPIVQPTIVPTTTVVQSQSESACTVRCSKGCSFPGRCRRYTDGNGNGKCDLGECV